MNSKLNNRKPRVTISFNAMELEFLIDLLFYDDTITAKYLDKKFEKAIGKIKEV